MAKIWNITDHPGTNVTPRAMMVLGRSVKPGKCIVVDDSRLAHARKVRVAIDAKKLAVGPQPPVDYVRAKYPPQALLPSTVTRAHGTTVAVPEVVKAAPLEVAEVAEEAPVVESDTSSSNSKSSPRKKRHNRS